ncbi:MAG: hypothetical protein ACR2GL_03020 [Thermoleophilaceae bacterium]
MRSSTDTPLRALGRGLAAGAAGTAAMTAAQTAYYKATGAEGSTLPADVAKRVIRGVLQREVSDERTEMLNTAMHWFYGVGWGALYGLAVRRPTHGIAFSAVVWGASLVELPAMKLGPPPWQMPPASIPPDLGFHLVYGVAVAQAHRALA